MISERDFITACVALFGKGNTTEEIAIRLAVYRKILEIAIEENLDEFDLRVALEDVDSFKPLEELVGIANEFHLIDRDSINDHIKIRDEIPLNSIFASKIPSDPSSININFLSQLNSKDDQTEFSSIFSIFETLKQTLKSIPVISEQSLGDSVFFPPFIRIGASTGNIQTFSTIAATSSFLDTILFLELLDKSVPSLSSTEEINAIIKKLDRIEEYLLPTSDSFDDGGVLCLSDDDDYPGSDRPTTMPCGMLLSVLDIAARHGTVKKELIPSLVKFLTTQMESDGGWCVYGYKSAKFKQTSIAIQKHAYFSYHAARGLLSTLDYLEPDLKCIANATLEKYTLMLMETFSNNADESGALSGWREGFAERGALCPYDTATNSIVCVMLAKHSPTHHDALLSLASTAIGSLVGSWQPAIDAKQDLHKITFRPPTTNGPSGTALSWEQPGRTKVLDAILTGYLQADIDPGIKGWELAERIAALIFHENVHGGWPDLNSEVSEMQSEIYHVVNNNNTMMAASALCKFVSAFAKRTGHHEK